MNFLRKMIGGKSPDRMNDEDFEQDIKALARGEDEAARNDESSGLVALYPELSKRRRKRGFADLDFDDYVPELDDYEPGQEGGYLTEDPAVRQASDQALEQRLAQVRKRLQEDLQATQPADTVKEAAQSQLAAIEDDEDEPETDEIADEDEPVDVDLSAEDDDDDAVVNVPAPAAGRSGGRRAGRVKTRLLGFDHASGSSMDPFAAASRSASAMAERYPAGWIVVLEGPGRGTCFTLFSGVSSIGRGEDQTVKLDFGDNSISRTNHAIVAYDGEQKKFFLGHGGKANIVRLNGNPVLSTEELTTNDKIRIGETTLWFVALCGADFDWNSTDEADSVDAAIA